MGLGEPLLGFLSAKSSEYMPGVDRLTESISLIVLLRISVVPCYRLAGNSGFGLHLVRLSCHPWKREVPIEVAVLGMTGVRQDVSGWTQAPGGNSGSNGINNNLAQYIHVHGALIYLGRHCCSIHQ